MRKAIWGLFIFSSFQTVASDDPKNINYDRAKFNYQMLCQGCHTPDGMGGKSIPKVKDFIGYFLQTEMSRDYLVRVPGSANSALNDKQLAEVLNWMILEFGGESVPENMQYYTADEVAKLRQEPLFEVVEYRNMLLKELLIK
jgi:hypothetical protein